MAIRYQIANTRRLMTKRAARMKYNRLWRDNKLLRLAPNHSDELRSLAKEHAVDTTGTPARSFLEYITYKWYREVYEGIKENCGNRWKNFLVK